MNLGTTIESPFEIKLSFNKFITSYESLLNSKNPEVVSNAKRVLNIAKDYPELLEGFTDYDKISSYQTQIESLLADVFHPILTQNEIKTAAVPFHNIVLKATERFKTIVNTLGEDFELEVVNMPYDQWYKIASSIILKACYGHDINFKRPFFYEIPDANGITKYYKILYNADFIEVVAKPNAPKISEKDIYELLDNFDNLELWKEKFPPNSYEFKGFIISNLFDITDDQSISNVKTTLIGKDKRNEKGFMEDFQDIFRSLFGLKEIKVGFSAYNDIDDTFERVPGKGIHSYLLHNKKAATCSTALCGWSYAELLKEKKGFSISDVELLYNKSKKEAPHVASLFQQGIKSAIFAPIANEEKLMGILEIVSEKPKQLNSINANKLVDVMPFIVAAVEQAQIEEENYIEAIIQRECTSIHPSVHWRFEDEARKFIHDSLDGKTPNFKQITFEGVYPLFGQIDIKGSSDARNWATAKDLTIQLGTIKSILEFALTKENIPIYKQYLYEIENYLSGLENHFQVDSEHQINSFIKRDIELLLFHLTKVSGLKKRVAEYFNLIDDKTASIYRHRKDYDDTIALINRHMASFLDEKQIEAQAMYPHYFERFKTDGVEHNMYIGESLTKHDSFNKVYLYNLRLWQLQIMCEMEDAYYQMQPDFPVKLDVSSMILVFNQPLSISFRMDEKQFDVDGTYNARYEIVKKRVDKAHIKGTNERVTQKGKISIVYSQKQDEIEYLKYITFLQSKNYLDTDVEIVELEDLQAVTGLKAIRVSVLYHKDKNDKAFYTYNDLMKEIHA